MPPTIKDWTLEDIIAFDIRSAWADEQRKRKRNRQTYEQVAAGIRAVYAGTHPNMTCPVEVAVIDVE